MKIPILIFSDAVSAPSGLARITRDLAWHLAKHMDDVFQVGTIGYGGPGSRNFPWVQYSWTHNDEWVIHDLPEIWKDFAGDRRGIFFSIQDATRMMWFAKPETCSDNRVRSFLINPPFEKWGYFPIDASGPNNKLTYLIKEAILGYDRVLCYSDWAEKIVFRTLGISDSEDRDLQSIPHGIDTKVFFPRGRKHRQIFGNLAVRQPVSIPDKVTLVGIVATNQCRKDYGMAIAACAELAKTRQVRLWIHTDAVERGWGLFNLLADFEFGRTKDLEPIISLNMLNDDAMAKLYSSCDITLAPGISEGFGYPIFESLACGTPVVHGWYGGAPEHMQENMLVPAASFRLEGVWNCLRPVFDAHIVARTMDCLIGTKATLPAHLAWENLWPRWEKWFRKGVHCEQASSDSSNAKVGEMAGVLELVEPRPAGTN